MGITRQFFIFCPWWPWPFTFELGRGFCTMYLTAKFDHFTFSRSEVIVRTKILTNKQTPLKTSTVLCYATPVDNHQCTFLHLWTCGTVCRCFVNATWWFWQCLGSLHLLLLTPLPWDKIFKIYSHMGTLTWNSCHSITTSYLRVHGNVMEKHCTDQLTRGSRCAVHLSWTR